MGRATRSLEVEGRAVTISNPEKLMFPAAGVTKAHVIEYYVRVAPYLLPHIQDRPVTLKRYPDGVQAPHFYEKDAPAYTPDWVRKVPVPRRTGDPDINYIVIDNLATLVWCTNTANLEIHPFLHRAPAIEVPTAVVFDLDPGEGAGILDCAEVAFELRAVLKGAGLETWAKLSGSKGLQVYAPLNTGVTYEGTQPFAKSIAGMLAAEHPDRVVAEMAKTMRHGKVFIDWSQNSDFKTTVAVYSMRAKRERPYCSLPVTWEELRKAVRKKDEKTLLFEPEPALRRLENVGDLFAPVLEKRQELPDPPAKPVRAPRKRRARAGAADAPELAGLPAAELRFVEPMRAKLAGALPQGAGWLYEIKFDGYRALAVKDKGEVTLCSRNGLVWNSRYRGVAEALARLEDGAVLDGEIVALDENGRPSFNLLQNYRGGGALYFYVFDLLAWRGKDLKGLPLVKRRELLQNFALKGLADPVRVSETLDAAPADLVRAAKEQGIEGILAKRSSSTYTPGDRSGTWVKYKTNPGQELVIGGYIPGNHGFDALLAGYYEGPRLTFIAKIRNGFTPASRKAVAARFAPFETPVCPFANLPEPRTARRGEALTAEFMKHCRWLEPALVAQVEFTEWTAANHLRHARFMALRDDKDPREVTHER